MNNQDELINKFVDIEKGFNGEPEGSYFISRKTKKGLIALQCLSSNLYSNIFKDASISKALKITIR